MPKVMFANALRGIAALSVMLAHCAGVFWLAPQAVVEITGIDLPIREPPHFAIWLQSSPIDWAAFGVALFFVISGFVIPFSFLKYSRFEFIVARILRIYPTYWAGLTLSLCLLTAGSYVLGSTFPHSIQAISVGYAVGLRDILWQKSIDGVVWTLEVELGFYFICAIIAPALEADL